MEKRRTSGWWRLALLGLVVTLITVGMLGRGSALAAGSGTYTSSGGLTVPASGTRGVAGPYPSTITVSGLDGVISKVTVTLTGVTHSFPDDIDILLVGPTGQTLVLMSDSGGNFSITDVNLTFDDAATNSMPGPALISAGTYKPTNNGTGDSFDAPAPAPPLAGYGTTLAGFNGTDPNGTWSLYVVDDRNNDTGSITGWSLTIDAVDPTPTPTATATNTPTPTPTETPTPTATPEPTNTPTPTATPEPTETPTPTATPEPTATPTETPTPTATPEATATATATNTPPATATATSTPPATATATATPTSTPPTTPGALTWYFAEGYTGQDFDQYLTIQNPNSTAANVRITYYLSGEAPRVKLLTVGPTSRYSVHVHETTEGVGRGKEVSAKVESTNGVGLIVERPMYFIYRGRGGEIPGGHNVRGATAPRAEWYFAEGYTGGSFDEFLTIMNPNPSPASITLTYYLASGAPVVKTVTVGAERRYSVRVHETAEGVGPNQEVSVKVSTSPSTPIVVERPMYFRYGSRSGEVAEGHVVMGIPAPAPSWTFADGDTTSTTDQFLTIMNPNSTAASVTLTYWSGGAVVGTKSLSVPAQQRRTVLAWEPVLGAGPNLQIATRVETSHPGGIVVERPLYGLKDGRRVGTTAVGATQAGLSWSFAEGYTGTGFVETLTIFNPSATTANVAVTYFMPGGAPKTVNVTVGARQRVKVVVNSPTEGVGPGKEVSATVTSTNGVPVVAERLQTFGYVGGINGGIADTGYTP